MWSLYSAGELFARGRERSEGRDQNPKNFFGPPSKSNCGLGVNARFACVCRGVSVCPSVEISLSGTLPVDDRALAIYSLSECLIPAER